MIDLQSELNAFLRLSHTTNNLLELLGLTISTIVLILGIERVGVSLIPVLAGLGVGGLALALAARPTLENIIAVQVFVSY